MHLKNIYEEFDLAEFLKNCVRKFYYFIIIAIMGVFLAAVWWMYKTQLSPTYSCRAVILVYPKDMATSDYVKTAIDGKIRPDELLGFKDVASSYTYLVQNPWVADRAIEELSKSFTPDQMAGIGLSSIFATVAEASPFLNVVVSHTDPIIASAFLSEIIRVFPDVMSDLNISTNLAVINYPETPQRANAPALFTLVALGMILGLGAAFLLVLFQQLCYTDFRVASDIPNILDIDLLGIFPACNTMKKKKPGKLSKEAENLYANILVTGKKKFLFMDCYGLKKETNRYILFELARRMVTDGYRVLFIDFCDMDKNYRKMSEFLPMWEDNHFEYQGIKQKIENKKMPGRKVFLEKFFLEDAGRYDFTLVNFPDMSQIMTDYFCLKHIDKTILLILHKTTAQKNARRTLKYIQKAGSSDVGAILLNISDRQPFSYYKQLSES